MDPETYATIKRLSDLLQKTTDIAPTIEIICYSCVWVATIIVMTISCRNDAFKELPFKVKFSLIGFLVYQPIQICYLSISKTENKS